jgi:hypothetical protein
MRIMIVQKQVVEIGDCPLDEFKRAIEDRDKEVINDVDKAGFDANGVLIVYSIITSETEFIPVAEPVADGL